ncbi:MAG: hypothetical protein JWQ09_6034 [Segetibacter sp.]|nr:hypothetical protein [Segetibacter sp.]
MIIYNITIKVHSAIQDQWLSWLKEVYIPEILGTRCFTDANILLLLEMDDTDGPTYAIQFRSESKALYNNYVEKFSRAMQQKSYDKWGDQFIAFRTVMQVVN